MAVLRKLFIFLTLLVLIMTGKHILFCAKTLNSNNDNVRMTNITSLSYTNLTLSTNKPYEKTVASTSEAWQKKIAQTTFIGSKTPVSLLSNPPIEGELRAEFHRRRNHLRNMCQTLYIQPATDVHVGDVNPERCQAIRHGYGYSECIFTQNFPLARSASSLTCLNHKVASTSIALTFLSADGSYKPIRKGSPHPQIVNLTSQNEIEFNFARKHFFKFIVVRHPLRRLLSAFRDKIEKADHWSLIMLRKDICDFIKRQNHSSDRKNPELTPQNKRGCSHASFGNEPADDDNTAVNVTSEVPTFEEFLKYIVNSDLQGEGYESHWVPYWRHCAPCSMDYDVIAKLESGLLELKFIWTRMGFRQEPWENKLDVTPPEENLLRKFYSELSPTLILEVYRNYLLDFKFFEYNITDVLEMGGHCFGHGCQALIFQYFKYIP